MFGCQQSKDVLIGKQLARLFLVRTSAVAFLKLFVDPTPLLTLLAAQLVLHSPRTLFKRLPFLGILAATAFSLQSVALKVMEECIERSWKAFFKQHYPVLLPSKQRRI